MLYPPPEGKEDSVVTRAQLLNYTCPTVADIKDIYKNSPKRQANAGTQWQPVHHADLVDLINSACVRRDLKITDEAFQLSDDRHDLFGFMRFDPKSAPSLPTGIPGGVLIPELGFRHSNMQRFALLGVCALRVYICANGVISGDFLFGYKSTRGNVDRLSVGIAEGMETWARQAGDTTRLIEFLANESITQDRADQLIMEGMRRNVYSSSQVGKIDQVYRAYEQDEHPHNQAFGPRTLWSLYNAVSEVGKTWSVRNIEKGLKGFPRVCADAYGFDLDSKLVTDAPTGLSTLSLN